MEEEHTNSLNMQDCDSVADSQLRVYMSLREARILTNFGKPHKNMHF